MIEDRYSHRYPYDPRDFTAHAFGWGVRREDPDLEGLFRPYGSRALDLFVTKIFARPPEPGENPFPTAAAMRAERRFQGSLMIIPTEFLADVSIPDDFTPTENSLKASTSKGYRRGDTLLPIAGYLPFGGAPSVPRKDLPILSAAREAQLFEIAVRAFYT